MTTFYGNNRAEPMGIRSYRVYPDGAKSARFGTPDNTFFAELYAARRGGCLFCSEIKVWNRLTGQSQTIASTMGIHNESDAQRPTLAAYLFSMCQKHLSA